MKEQLQEFIKPFIEGTQKTLAQMCQTKIIDTRLLDADTWPTSGLRIAAVIGITSKPLKGSMVLGFTEPVFLALMNNMLGESFTEIKDGVEDGASELSNIIFGVAKTELNLRGYGINMALPTVMTGQEVFASSGTGSASKAIQTVEFSTEAGAFWMVFQVDAVQGTDQFTDQPTNPTGQNPDDTYEKQLDGSVLLAFVQGIRRTMSVQFDREVTIGAPRAKIPHAFKFDIGSVIGINAPRFEGSFAMYFEGPFFLELINTMLGTTFTELNDEIQDGACEMVNICFGVAKQTLRDQGHKITMALPTLLRGKDISSSSSSKDQRKTILVPITCPSRPAMGTLWVEFSFHQNH